MAEQRPDGASGLGKCCGYGTLFQSRFEAPFQRAVDATITDVHLPPVVDKEIITHYLQSLRLNVFTEFDDVYRTAVEKQEEWAAKIKGTSITNTVRKIIFGEYLHAVLPSYIPRIIKAIKDPRWKRFFTLRIIVMHNHMVFTAQRAMAAVSVRVRLMNTAGVVDEENRLQEPKSKAWFDNLQLDEIEPPEPPAIEPPAPAPASEAPAAPAAPRIQVRRNSGRPGKRAKGIGKEAAKRMLSETNARRQKKR